ncbi:MAG TPA: RNA polymerase sigma factor [Flavisolibacter sp.]|nr:RNA polymerase sigma factor [Flavisolibacter sp.]
MINLQDIIKGCILKTGKNQKQLYEHYYGYCLKIVFRYIYRYDKAVDVVNDGFVKVLHSFDKFHYSDAENLERILMGWMRRIMINTAIDALRKDNLMPEIGHIDDVVWMQEDKSQSADQAILYKELIAEVKRLPPSYRVVFNMYVVDGFTHQEIANHLGISVGTSKSNLFKARDLLKKFIKGNEEQLNVCSI